MTSLSGIVSYILFTFPTADDAHQQAFSQLNTKDVEVSSNIVLVTRQYWLVRMTTFYLQIQEDQEDNLCVLS